MLYHYHWSNSNTCDYISCVWDIWSYEMVLISISNAIIKKFMNCVDEKVIRII